MFRSRMVNAFYAACATVFAAFASPASAAGSATAVFAGGCFWCVEADFEKLEGVEKAVSGYSGGDLQNPTYRNHKGHLEAVEVTYDPAVVSYRELVDYHLRHIDLFDAGGQFCDRGPSYTSAIFVLGEDERAAAEAAIAELEKKLGVKIVTPVRERLKFWEAEEYHQDYYKKNQAKYAYYRSGCGRDRRVKQIWGE